VSGVPTRGDALATLLRPPVRWGWEIAPPAPARTSPERNQPPARRQAQLVSASKVSKLPQATGVLIATWLVVLLIDASIKFNGITVTVVNVCTMPVAHWAGQKLEQFRDPSVSPRSGKVLRWTITALLFSYISLAVQAYVTNKESNRRRQWMVPEPADAAAADREYQAEVQRWQARVGEYESQEVARVQAADLWYPVCPSPSAHLIACFGGSSDSWRIALITLGSSILGSGERLLVTDLSQRYCTQDLEFVATKAGLPLSTTELAGTKAAQGLLDGIKWEDLVGVLVESAYLGHDDSTAARDTRRADRVVLRDAYECLREDRQPSVKLLRTALGVIQGVQPSRNGPELDRHEYDALTRVVSQVQREHGGVMERVIRLDQMLRDLEPLDPAPESATALAERPSARSDRGPALEILSVDKQAAELDSELFVAVAFELLLRRLRSGERTADTLLVLGADRIPRDALENLGTFAERSRVRVILFFEHLREEAVDLAGGGGAAAVFFTLANHREAAEATSFIGSGYRWVESQRTRGVSASVTQQSGREHGSTFTTTQSFMDQSRSEAQSSGFNFSESLGRSEEFSVSEQRVNETLVEPQVLQGLPVTGCLYVEIGQGGRRRIASVDCNPVIGMASRVSELPRGAG
jgi:hypothetical protein